MESKARRNNFDTLRHIFAVLVVFSHSFPLLRGTNATEPLFRLTGGVMTLGELSVWSFFIISGYLITQSWQRSSTLWHFLRRRVSRIYPAFLAATCLCAVLVYPIAAPPGQPSHVSLVNYISHAARLKLFNQGHAFHFNPFPDEINGSLWSISYEFWCYLGLAFLGLTRLLRRPYVLAIALLTMAAHLALPRLAPHFSLDRVAALPFFLTGMLLQLFSPQLPLKTSYAAIAFLLLSASFLFPPATIFTLPLLGAYLILWLAYLPALHSLNLGRAGDFSYGTYLYAFPIQQLLTYYFRPRLTPLLLFSIAAPLSVAMGVLSWHLIEKHFLSPKTIHRLEETPVAS